MAEQEHHVSFLNIQLIKHFFFFARILSRVFLMSNLILFSLLQSSRVWGRFLAANRHKSFGNRDLPKRYKCRVRTFDETPLLRLVKSVMLYFVVLKTHRKYECVLLGFVYQVEFFFWELWRQLGSNYIARLFCFLNCLSGPRRHFESGATASFVTSRRGSNLL